MSFRDESSNILPLRRLQTDELRPWLEAQAKRPYAPAYFIWHHTESPTESSWHGYSTLKGIFDWYHSPSGRGFTYGMGPEFWSARDGIWIGHHPSVKNSVGATGWNGYQSLHMETVHNGDWGPYTEADLAMHAERARIICDFYGIPIQWVPKGSNGGALKGYGHGIAFHRELYINGQPPKTCPGRLVLQRDALPAIERAGEEDMTADEVRAIIREEMEVVWSETVDRDQSYLVDQKIISAPRAKTKAASVSYVDSLLARVLKKALDPQ